MRFINQIAKYFKSKDYAPVWQAFASKVGGTYSVDGPNDVVQFSLNGYNIIFSTYMYYSTSGNRTLQKEYCRAMAEVIAPGRSVFKITRQGFFENIGKLLGLQDISVGDERIDKKYIIQTNDELKMQMLFTNKTFSAEFANPGLVRLELTNGTGLFNEKPAEGRSLLSYISEQPVRTPEQLDRLYSFWSVMINKLERSGIIQQG